MPELIFTSGTFAPASVRLTDGTFAVGRSRKNQIIIQDASVSGEHCELLVYGAEVIVRERGSRNGTFVDGARVTGQAGVRHRQRIRFGKVEARLDLELSDDGDATGFSAIEDYRKIMQAHRGAPKPVTTFPVTVAPADQDDASVTHLTPAPLTATTPPPQAEALPENAPKTNWQLWAAVIALLTLIAAALLLWKR